MVDDLSTGHRWTEAEDPLDARTEFEDAEEDLTSIGIHLIGDDGPRSPDDISVTCVDRGRIDRAPMLNDNGCWLLPHDLHLLPIAGHLLAFVVQPL